MSTNVSTPPKSRGKHHHSKSATPSNPNTMHTTPARNNQSRHRNNRPQQENAVHSELYTTDSQPELESQRHRDNRHGHVTDDGLGSDSVQKSKRKKPPKQNRRSDQNDTGSPPNRNGYDVNRAQDIIAVTPAQKQKAYAGPTFHASPAPSALPMPKFFSKSVPADINDAGLQARLDAEQHKSPPLPSDIGAVTAPPRNEESPLDFLFKSDREQKAKRNSGMLTPNSKLDRTASYESSASGPRKHHDRQPSNGSGRAMFPLELDGNHSQNDLAQTNASDHVHYGRSTTAPATLPRARTSRQEQENINLTLKEKLFGLPQQHHNTGPLMNETPQEKSDPSSRFHTPSPFYRPGTGFRSASGPSTPAVPSDAAAQASYHYGNRNLSPLFKAAKGDSAQRSSNLRQELSPQNARYSATSNDHDPSLQSPSRSGPLLQDASAISRNFLNSHIQAAGSMRELPTRSPQAMNVPHNVGYQGSHKAEAHRYHASSDSPAPHTAHTLTHTANRSNGYSAHSSPAPASGPDVRSMENDLRRMLKLGDYGNGGTTGTT